jgi:hypothetical protein
MNPVPVPVPVPVPERTVAERGQGTEMMSETATEAKAEHQ